MIRTVPNMYLFLNDTAICVKYIYIYIYIYIKNRLPNIEPRKSMTIGKNLTGHCELWGNSLHGTRWNYNQSIRIGCLPRCPNPCSRIHKPRGEGQRTCHGFSLFFSGCSWLFHSPNKASAAEGFLLGLYRIAFVNQDLPSSPTCLDLPRLAWTCLAQLPIACQSGFAVAAAVAAWVPRGPKST